MRSVVLGRNDDLLVRPMAVVLERAGFAVHVEHTVDAIEAAVRDEHPDLLLVDADLPDGSGVDLGHRLRLEGEVGLVVVAPGHTEEAIVAALELGADDVITQPHRLHALVARVRAVLRRCEVAQRRAALTHAVAGASALLPAGDRLGVGPVVLDRESHEVFVDGRQIALPLKQFDLLALLLERAGRVAARDLLLREVWGDGFLGDHKTLDAHITRLRNAIEVDPSHPRRIVTIRGLGYRYSLDDAATPIDLPA